MRWVSPQGKETLIAKTTEGYRVLETSYVPGPRLRQASWAEPN